MAEAQHPKFGVILEKALEGGLSEEDAHRIALDMLEGRLGELEAAALLVALRARSETPQVIAGFAKALRSLSVKPPITVENLLDTAGTGGDGKATFNASTAAALVASSLGAPVAKHGNRSVTSRSGSADFLEALGYPLDLGPSEAACSLTKAGFTFLFAPRYHPLMARVMPVRRRLGIRTVFNLVGPLSNPLEPPHQLLGVAVRELLDVMAEAGASLGFRRLVLVHGKPGVDEVSVFGETSIVVVEGGEIVHRGRYTPGDLGLAPHSLSEVMVSGPSESAALFREAARGRGRRPVVDFIAANAGFALYAHGAADTPEEGVELALQALGEGSVAPHLERVLEVARECRGSE